MRDVHARRHDVDEVSRLAAELIPLVPRYARGPVDDQRCRNAAFVDPMLEQAKRRVRCVRPRQAVARERTVGAQDDHSSAPSLEPERSAFRATAIVGQEDDERVVELVRGLQGVDDFPEALIDAVDLGRVNRHFQSHLFLLRFG